MSKHLNFLRTAAIAGFLAFPAFAEEAPNASTVVATINSQDITLGEMIAVRASLPQQYQSLAPDVLYSSILDQLIQQSALAQSLSGVVPSRVEVALKNEKRSLLAAEALEAFLSDDGVTEEALKAAYESKYSTFVGDDEYNASHILVETAEEALAIRTELTEGADFAETAKAKSTGPSGPSGGLLGWFELGQMVKPFEDTVVTLAVGEVSQPIQTQFGWHVILLNDARKSQAPSFEEARSELANEAQRAAVNAYITKLTDAADIDRSKAELIDPMLLQRIDLLSPSQGLD